MSGGDTVFDTRSASGNLGDLVIVGTGNGRLNKLVKAKLIEDMTPYYSSMKNVKKYDSAVKSIAKQAGNGASMKPTPAPMAQIRASM